MTASPRALAAPPPHEMAPAPVTGWRSRLGDQASTTFDALRVRDYRLLFQGNAAVSIGYWMQQAALGWLVLELTNSPLYLGLATFSRNFPMLVISPFGGVVADRLDRKWLILSSQIAQLVLTALLALLVIFHFVNIWHVLVVSFLMGAATSIQVPARQALIPALVGRERLVNALALYSLSLNASRILGPSLAGAVMGWTGVGGCLLLQTVGYVWMVGNVLQIGYGTSADHRREGRAGATVFQNLTEGLSYCWRTRPVALQLLIAAVPTIVAYPYMQFLPAFARDEFKMGPSGLGLLMTSMGLGALAGSFWIATRRTIRRKSLVTVICAAGYGLFLCLFAAAGSLLPALLFLSLAGATSSVYQTLNGTIIQELCPDEYRGRVSSVYMVTWGMLPLGALPAGALAEVYGARVTVFVGGAITLAFAVLLLLIGPRLRRA